MISLILTDLDGTLFRDDKSISDYSKQMIARAQEKGILFGVCTSRAKINAAKFLDGINPDVLITNGGGMVTYGDDLVYSCEFTVEEIRTLIKATFDVCGPDAVLSVDNDHGLYCNTKEELGDKYWTQNDFSDFRESGMKMCVETLDKEKVEKIAASLGADKLDYLPFSDIPWYKFSKKGATKERAIEALCQKLKITPEQIVAFGDDFNDIGMLKLCGKGIAMKNAIPQVQEVADEVCDTNENDGVGKWIEEKLL
ncbi:MAG: HAD family phosphatase [Treponema sp.]|nr:HAD family phosphatase [Treponema sp.]